MSPIDLTQSVPGGADQLVRNIATRVASLVGDEFFAQLVQLLRDTLECDYVFVGRLDRPENPRHVNTIAVQAHGNPGANFDYALNGTPCESVASGRACSIPGNVQRSYPNDQLLIEMGIDSYVGAPLLDSTGKALGILVALHTKPFPNVDRALAILEVFASRAAAELDRLITVDELRRSEERYALAQAAANIGVWDWNIVTNEVYRSEITAPLFGFRADEFPGTYESFVAALHPDDRPAVLAAVDAALAGAAPYSIEYRIRSPRGEERWILDAGIVRRDSAGRPVQMLGTVRDVTSLKRRDAELRESESRWRNLVRNLPDFVMRIDPELRIHEINRILPGYTEEQVKSSRITDFIPPESHAMVRANIARAFSTNQMVTYQLTAAGGPGEVREYETRVCPVQSGSDSPTALLIATDVTDRMNAERELRQSRNLLAAHLHSTPLAVVHLNGQGRVLEWNSSATRMFGFSEIEAIGRDVVAMIVPEDRVAEFRSLFGALLKGRAGHVFTGQSVTRDGRRITCRWYNTPLQDAHGAVATVMAMAEDITQQVSNAEMLRRSEASMLQGQQIANLGSWEWNMESGDLWWSDQLYRIYGYAPAEIKATYEAYEARVHADDLPIVRKARQAMAEPAWQPPGMEYRIVRVDGSVRYVFDRARIVRDENGTPRRVIGAVQDITERKRVDEVISMLARGGGQIDLDTFLADCVRQLAEVYGVRYAFVGRLTETPSRQIRTLAVWTGQGYATNFTYSLAGTPCQDVLDLNAELIPRDAARLYPNDALLADMGVESYFGAPLIAADGRLLGILSIMDVRPMAIEGWTRPVLGVFATRLANEIERAEALAELRQSREQLEERVRERTAELSAVNQELEAFTYSVSHDLRAPLRAIDGFSRALEQDLGREVSAENAEHLQRVRRAAQRMGELIDAMLRLSRLTRSALTVERNDLSSIAADVASALCDAAPGRRMSFEIAEGVFAQCDAALIRVAIDNLLQNAVKYSAPRDLARISFRAFDRDGERVYVVEDNGVGFDMQYSDKLFGAFQRLHAVSEFEGLGIGLATVKRIVHRHGGRVWAESAPNQGARFFFTLGPGATMPSSCEAA